MRNAGGGVRKAALQGDRFWRHAKVVGEEQSEVGAHRTAGENQCVFLRTVAGEQWIREGRKNGIPTLARVLADAEEWRLEEYEQTKREMEQAGTEGGEYAAEVRSAAHDVLKGGHDRDYRGFALFYENLFGKNDIAVRVFDLRSRGEGGYILTVNLFTGRNANDDTPMIDLMASRHHMRWLKLCDDTLLSDRKTWRIDFRDRFREFVVEGWAEKLSRDKKEEGRLITLNPCRF